MFGGKKDWRNWQRQIAWLKDGRNVLRRIWIDVEKALPYLQKKCYFEVSSSRSRDLRSRSSLEFWSWSRIWGRCRTEVLCSEDRDRVTFESACRALLGKGLSTACGWHPRGQIFSLCIDLEVLCIWVLRTDACLRMLIPPGEPSSFLLKKDAFSLVKILQSLHRCLISSVPTCENPKRQIRPYICYLRLWKL